MDSMYDIIMNLPMFQGVSHEKISELIEKTPFHFMKFATGEKITDAGEPCTKVNFIVSGEVKVSYKCLYRQISLTETLQSPGVIGIDYLFGRDTIYPFDASAVTDCGIMQLEKADYVKILRNDKVFLFNMLNYLSRNYQKTVNGLLSLSEGSVAERLAFVVITFTQHGASKIFLDFKQKDLCEYLGVQRGSLIYALESMKELGILEYDASHIEIKNREKLFAILAKRE